MGHFVYVCEAVALNLSQPCTSGFHLNDNLKPSHFYQADTIYIGQQIQNTKVKIFF